MKKKLLGLLILSSPFLMLSCSKAEKQQFEKAKSLNAVESDAFTKYYNSRTGKEEICHLKNATAVFKIECTGDYYDIAKYSIDKISNFTKLYITQARSNIDTDFIICTKKRSDNSKYYGTNAICRTDENEYAYTRATIEYYTSKMDYYDLDIKKHIALHEMGHAVGLEHINSYELKNYTVMYPNIDNSTEAILDYTELDKYNITWYYGGTYKER